MCVCVRACVCVCLCVCEARNYFKQFNSSLCATFVVWLCDFVVVVVGFFFVCVTGQAIRVKSTCGISMKDDQACYLHLIINVDMILKFNFFFARSI